MGGECRIKIFFRIKAIFIIYEYGLYLFSFKEVTDMEIWNWQLLTVVPLGCMCLYLYFIVGNLMRKSHSVGEIAWIAEFEKEGKRKILELPEGSFLLGNGFMNDIRIRAGDETIR